jgi:hypothetical protein
MGGGDNTEAKRMEQERGFIFQEGMAKSDFERAMEKFRAEVQARREDETTAYERMLEQKKSDIDRSSGIMSDAEARLFSETESELPELGVLRDSILQGATKEQEMARNAMRANLAQSGVRGGQAATLLNRGTGELNQELIKDLNQLSYDEALNRRQTRSNYLGNKASTGAAGVVR